MLMFDTEPCSVKFGSYISNSSSGSVSDGYTELRATKEVQNVVVQINILRDRLAPQGCMPAERDAMLWLFRQIVHRYIDKYQSKLQHGFASVVDDAHMMNSYSLDVLLALWHDLGGKEEELGQ